MDELITPINDRSVKITSYKQTLEYLMSLSKTIKIYLLNGEPTGTKVVEVSNWSGKAYLIPRNQLSQTFKDIECAEDLSSPGLYFLLGTDEVGNYKIYVGEAENTLKRILNHNTNKDFWNLVITFVSKDSNLTKAHVKYLESLVIDKLKYADRITLENTGNSKTYTLPRSDRDEMNEFLANIELILSSLGLTFLTEYKSDQNDSNLFYCKSENGVATARYTNEGLVILSGSIVATTTRESFSKYQIELRMHSIDSEELVNQEGKMILIKDKLFSSPSTASTFVLGRSSNGWVEWKNKGGETLDKIIRHPQE